MKRQQGQKEKTRSLLSLYCRDIDRIGRINSADEDRMGHGIRAGDPLAREQLVCGNLALVVNIARKHIGRGLDLEDLIEEGNLGLIHAAETFDPDKDCRFGIYAAIWIRQAIRRALGTMARPIRVPHYVFQLATNWWRAFGRLQQELGRAPTQEEVAARLPLSERKRRHLEEALQVWRALPQTGHADADHPSLEEVSLADVASTPDLAAVSADLARHVMNLVSDLEQREQVVLRERFGLDDGEPKTFEKIGEHLGLTRERVRQLTSQALRKLRVALEESMPDDY